jgi:hypothetical protein
MRTPWLIFVACSSLVIGAVGALGVGCGGGGNDKAGNPQCSDGIDNDGDGLVDFPDDPGCVNAEGSDEHAGPYPQCSDGRDNDGDGKIDFPNDPGCLVPQQDSETDDCPDGPNCPQCSNGKDDDGNGVTDYPDDPGCTSAADPDEFTDNATACGADTLAQQLPFDGHVTMGMIDPASISHLSSPTCGGAGGEQIYELRIMRPTVVSATTDLGGTSVDTVLYVRPTDCTNPAAELVCNDDVVGSSVANASTINVSIVTPGLYYLVVDSHDAGLGGNFEMQVDFLAGEGEPCTANNGCGTGLVCRIPLGQTAMVCSKHVCEDGVDDDGDGKLDYPTDPGCDSPTDDDESDTCPGAGCPVCSDGIDNDGDGQTDYPNDSNCSSAAGKSESCSGETDPTLSVASFSTTGTTTGLHNDTATESCQTNATGNDVAVSLHLPVPVTTIQIDTIGSSYDTILSLRDASCSAEIACNDDGNGVQSLITQANLAAGNYEIIVDGYNGNSGPFTLNVKGFVANGTACTSPLFASGVLACTGTATCTAGTCQ